MQSQFVRRFLAGAAAVAGMALVAPATAEAQIGFVVQGQYGLDYEALGVGGGIDFGLGSLTEKHGVRAEATFDYFFTDDPLTVWELNGNVLYDIPSTPGLYVGAGLNYAKVSVDCTVCEAFGYDADASDIGLNALAGWNFAGSKGPFVSARIALGGGEQIYLGGGFRF
jgi:opacity protein-like surface antigen